MSYLIDLYSKGYSRSFLYEQKFKDLKRENALKRKYDSIKEIRQEAKKEVDKELLENFRKREGLWVIMKMKSINV